MNMRRHVYLYIITIVMAVLFTGCHKDEEDYPIYGDPRCIGIDIIAYAPELGMRYRLDVPTVRFPKDGGSYVFHLSENARVTTLKGGLGYKPVHEYQFVFLGAFGFTYPYRVIPETWEHYPWPQAGCNEVFAIDNTQDKVLELDNEWFSFKTLDGENAFELTMKPNNGDRERQITFVFPCPSKEPGFTGGYEGVMFVVFQNYEGSVEW